MRMNIVSFSLATALAMTVLARGANAQTFSLEPPPPPQSGADSTTKSGDDDAYGPNDGDFEFTLAGNGSNDNDFDNGSGGASASIGYFLSDAFELSLRQGFSLSDFGETEWIASTRVALDFHFDIDCVQPFIGVNVGYVYGDAVEETFEAAPEAGLKVFVKPETFIFAMAEYQFFFDNANEADESFEDGQFVYSIGIGFLF